MALRSSLGGMAEGRSESMKQTSGSARFSAVTMRQTSCAIKCFLGPNQKISIGWSLMLAQNYCQEQEPLQLGKLIIKVRNQPQKMATSKSKHFQQRELAMFVKNQQSELAILLRNWLKTIARSRNHSSRANWQYK